MTTKDKHLDKVLASQRLKDDGSELKALRAHRADVEAVLREAFGSKLTVRFGGSKAKGTMIRESYDLDVICYFEHDCSSAGETLKEIYFSVKKALSSKYMVVAKKSALRLMSPNGDNDFHIDVVPGRFIDGTKTDANLYQNVKDKERLKTNIQTHIDHVRDSGHADVVSILKLLSCTYDLKVKTFVLELAGIEALAKSKATDLTGRVEDVLTVFRDKIDTLSVEDPANSGNDLSGLWTASARKKLRGTAKDVLEIVDESGWEKICDIYIGAISNEKVKKIIHKEGPGTRPWSTGG